MAPTCLKAYARSWWKGLKPLLALQSQVNGLVDLDAIVKYIFERQNPDGGYTFCRWTESNAQDTFYALSILEILGVEPVNLDKTITFLKSLQYDDGKFDSIKIAYYVVKSLAKLGEKPLKPIEGLEDYLPDLIRSLGSPYVDIEALSEVESIYVLVDLCKTLNIGVDSDRIIGAILSIKSNDGSFGSPKRSKIASTFYALATLKTLGYEVSSNLMDTLSWIRKCERSVGGFSQSSEAAPIYLEDTYFGIRSLEILNEGVRYPQETLKFIAHFQNPNGGFRRSIFLGISDFESTYQALYSIKVLLSSLRLRWI
jgi:hypothetical protein